MESLKSRASVKAHVLNLAKKVNLAKRDNLNLNRPDPSDSGQINPAFSFENIVDEKREIPINANMTSESKYAVLHEDCNATDKPDKDRNDSRITDHGEIFAITAAQSHSKFKQKEDLELDFSGAKLELEGANPEASIVHDRSGFRNKSCRSSFELSSRLAGRLHLRRASCSVSHAPATPELASGWLERQENIKLPCPDVAGKREFRVVVSTGVRRLQRPYYKMSSISGVAYLRVECTVTVREMEKLMNNVRSWSTVVPTRHGTPQELRRSDYSLVSCGELTSGSLDVWRALPDQVKYDPALAPFRELYEKEHGRAQESLPTAAEATLAQNGSYAPKKRLPLVKSAPQIDGRTVADSAERRDVVVGVAIPESGEDADHLAHQKVDPPTQLENARHYAKMASLLACWLFFTAVFMLCNERETLVRHSSVAVHEIKDYYLSGTLPLKVLIQLEGPFWSAQQEKSLNSSDTSRKTMAVWLERSPHNGSVDPHAMLNVQKSSKWYLTLLDEVDFSIGETRSEVLTLNASDSALVNQTFQHVLRIQTDSNKTTPFTLTYTMNPLEQTTGVALAAILLLGLYALIIFEIINRTLAAVITSTCALAVLAVVGERPSLPELVSWLDVETLLLLFSMMLLVAIMAETGLFDYIAVFTFSVTKGRMWPLINLLCFFTAILSTFLDNVTTVLLMTPVTIRLCEVMQLNPVPILMAMVLYSNIGGTATPVGDPPNVIIASNPDVINSGINFASFTIHMTLGIVLVSVQTYFQLRFMYRDTSKLRLSVPKDIQDARQQISVWRRAAASLASYSTDEQLVRAALEKKVAKLDARLRAKLKERRKRAVPVEDFEAMLAGLKDKYKIRDKALLIKASIAITFVVLVFFMHSIPELKRISLGWTALLGAILLLILADRDDMESVLHRVEWSTLLFFAALFVLMEALSKLGLIQWIGGLTESLILQVDESARLAVSIVLMLWVSGLASAFVDNIPLTTMMIRVVTSLGSNPALGLPMAPLIWALAFGACLGGNGTLIGASANVVTAGVAEQHGYRFTFMEFFKVGFPLMLGHLVVATGYLLLCHCAFTWH